MGQYDAGPSNKQRGKWAQSALDAFARVTSMDSAGEDDDTILGDLLTDLMHWCDHHKVDFEATLANSIDVHQEEVAEEAVGVMQ